MASIRQFFLLVMVGMLTGCGTSAVLDAPRVVNQGNKFILDEEPEGAIGVSDAKEAGVENEEVVLLGRIRGNELEPWSEGRASFLLTDAAVALMGDSHDHDAEGHDPATCPFCNKDKSATDWQAIVQFVGDDGKVIPIDARELLGVQKDQLVVVRGVGKIDALGNLVVAADGIYKRE